PQGTTLMQERLVLLQILCPGIRIAIALPLAVLEIAGKTTTHRLARRQGLDHEIDDVMQLAEIPEVLFRGTEPPPAAVRPILADVQHRPNTLGSEQSEELPGQHATAQAVDPPQRLRPRTLRQLLAGFRKQQFLRI